MIACIRLSETPLQLSNELNLTYPSFSYLLLTHFRFTFIYLIPKTPQHEKDSSSFSCSRLFGGTFPSKHSGTVQRLSFLRLCGHWHPQPPATPACGRFRKSGHFRQYYGLGRNFWFR